MFIHRYNPNLYGGIQRKYLAAGLLLIFDNYVIDKGQLIYYLKFMCELGTRKLCRFKHEPESWVGILIIHRTSYQTIEINLHIIQKKKM
jgi:hypothetical protein